METKIERTLDWLKSNSFSQTIDKIGMATDSCPLYYKQVKDNDFLVITHYNSKYKSKKNMHLQGFDVFYFQNLDPETIGEVNAKAHDFWIPSFDIDRDIKKLREFLIGITGETII